MAYVVFADDVTTIVIRHVELKANGSFQYRRRIPNDLQSHYGGRAFYVRMLKRNTGQLADHSRHLTARLDAEWEALRTGKQAAPKADQDVSASDPAHMVYRVFTGVEQQPIVPGQLRSAVSLSDALAVYVRLHAEGGQKRFAGDCERVIHLVTARAGDLPLELYSRAHAGEFRDHLAAQHSTGTVRRYLNTLVAIINKARREKQLQISNVFEGPLFRCAMRDRLRAAEVPHDIQELLGDGVNAPSARAMVVDTRSPCSLSISQELLNSCSCRYNDAAWIRPPIHR